MKKKVLITRHLLGEGMKILKQKYDIVNNPESFPFSRGVLLKEINNCHGLLCVGDKIDKEIIDNGKALQVISQAAVGVDNIDIDYCTTKRIPVGNTPGVLVTATANIGILHILNGMRGFTKGNFDIRKGQANSSDPCYTLGRDLEGKNLVIIGFGNIGKEVAIRATVFGFNLFACSPDFTEDIRINDTVVKAISFDEGIKIADVLSLHLPLTKSSRNLINKDIFRRMKKNAVLVNLARGAIVNTEDLYSALVNHEIGFASLDVLDPEPIPVDHPLLSLDNVFLTPHMGSSTVETRIKMADLAVRNLMNGLEGIPLETSVNQNLF